MLEGGCFATPGSLLRQNAIVVAVHGLEGSSVPRFLGRCREARVKHGLQDSLASKEAATSAG